MCIWGVQINVTPLVADLGTRSGFLTQSLGPNPEAGEITICRHMKEEPCYM